MITVRRSEERGHADHGWLDTHHTFSFADYYDPKHMGFRSLRVINDDRVAPGQGFGTHPHRDMEIVSYVVAGKLAHKDSMGHVEFLGPNEVQKMSAGTGIRHSEYNGADTEPVHFLQIWILPRTTGTTPNYEQLSFSPDEKQNRLKLLAAPERTPGAVQIDQDVHVYATEISPGASLTHALLPGRAAWVQIVGGEITLNGQHLRTGDGAAIEEETAFELVGAGQRKTELLLFDLA